MPWQNNYREARFRDVNFFTESTEGGSFSQRIATFSFPGRDEILVQPLGLQKKEFTVNAYMLGDDYITDTDLLLQACENQSPGELVLPELGSFIVVCVSARVLSRTLERRIQQIVLTFIQSDLMTWRLTENINTSIALMDKRNAALVSLQKYFAEAYDLVNKPYAYSVNALETFDSFVNEIKSNRKIVGSASGFVRNLSVFTTRAAFLIYEATDLIDSIVTLLTFGTTEDDSFEATPNNAKDQFNEFRGLLTFEATKILDDTDPTKIIVNSAQIGSVIVMSGLLSIIVFDSVEQANIFKNVVLDKIDSLALIDSIPSSLYEVLYALRKAIMEDIESRSSTLSRVATYKRNKSTPALTLSMELYGTIENAEDIVSRNTIVHPGFVPGLVDIEVLVQDVN